MVDEPNISDLAKLIGDPARASILASLMGGIALTATELSLAADITPQTTSSHLAKLLDGGLVTVERQGRHRYFRLASDDVPQLIEMLMGVASRLTPKTKPKVGPRDPELRLARSCYDHLAGDLAVRLLDGLVERELVQADTNALRLTDSGRIFFTNLGMDIETLEASRRVLCRPCLDWSERRHHLAGSLGNALLDFVLTKRWARRVADGRAIHFSPKGRLNFESSFHL